MEDGAPYGLVTMWWWRAPAVEKGASFGFVAVWRPPLGWTLLALAVEDGMLLALEAI